MKDELKVSKSDNKAFLHLTAQYTVLWLVCAVLIAAIFTRNGRAALWVKDGVYQHFAAFDYLCQYLRALLIDHSPLPIFNFTLGQGADIITTLNSYDFLDPICALSAMLVPLSRLQRYTVMIFLKLWLTGLSFLAYCAATERKPSASVIAGAVMYTFSGAVLFTVGRHPNFINWAYYFPFLIAGAEIYLRKGKGTPLLLAVFFNLVTSFYTFYLNALLLAIHALAVCGSRAVCTGKPAAWKEELGKLIRLAGITAVGGGLAAFVLLPTVQAFLSNPRVMDETGYLASSFSYGWKFTRLLPEAFTEPCFELENYTVIGVGVFCFVPLVLLFTKKGHGWLKLLVALGLAGLCLPFVGRIMNGMSYPSNRWAYALVFYASFSAVEMEEELKALTRADRIRISILTAAYCAILLHIGKPAFTLNLAATVVMLGMTALVFIAAQAFMKRRIGETTVCLALAGAVFQTVFTFSGSAGNAVSEYLERDQVPACYTDFSSSAAAGREGFYRVERQEEQPNVDGFLKTNGTSVWWSMLPSSYLEYYNGLELNTVTANCNFFGLGGRTGLLELAGVRYYTRPADDRGSVPFGYEETDSPNPAYQVFENRLSLPIAYTYDRYITRENYEKLDGIEKEQVLLQAAVLEEPVSGLEEAAPETEVIKLDFEAAGSEGAVWGNGRLEAEAMGSVFFSADIPEDCEIYLRLKGVRTADENKLVGTGAGRSIGAFADEEWTAILNPSYNWSFPRDSVVFALGPGHAGKNRFSLTLGRHAALALEDVEILAAPTALYQKAAEERRACVPEDVIADHDRITGRITVPEKRLLQIAVPYSPGWKASVDGKDAAILRSDVLYMGLVLDAGEHTVELTYRTPWLGAGCMISVITLVGICVYEGFIMKKRNRFH